MAEARGARRRRRLIRTITVIAGLALLTAVIWTDVNARTRARHEAAALRAALSHLATLQEDVTTTQTDTAHTTSVRDALVATIASTLGQLATTNSSLATTNVHAYLQGANINTLQTCLGGVQNALTQIKDKNNIRAAQAITAVSGPCTCCCRSRRSRSDRRARGTCPRSSQPCGSS